MDLCFIINLKLKSLMVNNFGFGYLIVYLLKKFYDFIIFLYVFNMFFILSKINLLRF